jgi:hypothetical protein
VAANASTAPTTTSGMTGIRISAAVSSDSPSHVTGRVKSRVVVLPNDNRLPV